MTDKYSQFNELSVSFAAPRVLHVQFNKPKKLNAVGEKTWRQYRKVFETAGNDPNVAAIIVSGQGRAFCSGLDLTDAGSVMGMEDLDASRRAIRLKPFIKDFQQAIKAAYDIKKPVIGVAHGVSYGLAIDILSNVDIRFATNGTRFSVREIAIGMAADIGSLQQLPRIVGNHSWLREIVYTGREFSAEEALNHGLVSRVYSTQEESLNAAIDLAKQFAEYSPVALYGAKHSLNYSIDHTLEDGLDHIAEFNSYAIQTDLAVGISAQLSKKKPIYGKL